MNLEPRLPAIAVTVAASAPDDDPQSCEWMQCGSYATSLCVLFLCFASHPSLSICRKFHSNSHSTTATGSHLKSFQEVLEVSWPSLVGHPFDLGTSMTSMHVAPTPNQTYFYYEKTHTKDSQNCHVTPHPVRQ